MIILLLFDQSYLSALGAGPNNAYRILDQLTDTPTFSFRIRVLMMTSLQSISIQGSRSSLLAQLPA